MARLAVVNRVQDLWVNLAGVATSLPADGVRVVVAAESRLCPPAWAGIVVLGSSGIATAPDAATARFLRESLNGRPLRSAVEAEWWRGEYGVVDVLGPASLAYLEEQEFRPATRAAGIAQLPPGHPDLVRLVADVSEDDVAESGIDEIDVTGVRRWGPHTSGRGGGLPPVATLGRSPLRAHQLPLPRSRTGPCGGFRCGGTGASEPATAAMARTPRALTTARSPARLP